jgi:hypothetical protein
MGDKWKNLYYLESSIKIKVVVQGQPFAAGQVVVSFTPTVGTGVYTAATRVSRSNLVNYKIVPHVIVDPSKSQTYELSLPVSTPTGFYDPDGTAKLGSYKMRVTSYNPLFSGTDVAASMGICIYMSFDNPNVQGMTLSSQFVEEKKPGGMLSNFAKGAGKFTSMMSVAFPAFTPQLTLFSNLAGAAGDVLAWLGFSKPPIADISLFPLTRVVDNYSQFDGKSSAIVLGGSQSTSVGISPAMAGSDMNDMLISHICNIKGLVAQEYIPTTVAEGDFIQLWNVMPMLDYNSAGQAFPTPLSGTALPFNYWTGDIKFTFEFVASVFHRATYLISWDPDPLGLPTLEQALQTLQNVTVSVSGNTTVEILIPYKQPTPWLQNLKYPGVTAPGKLYRNGLIYLYCINPITSNGSTDPIALNVYTSSDNVEFAVPNPTKVKKILWRDDPAPSSLLSSEFVPVESIDFGGRSDLSHHTYKSFGESYTSIKQLTSKCTSSQHVSIGIAADTGADYAYVQFPVAPRAMFFSDIAGGLASQVDQTFLSYFSPAYLGYRGGIRTMFHTRVLNDVAGGATAVIHPHMWIAQQTTNPNAGMYASGVYTAGLSTISDFYAFSAGNRDIHPNMETVIPSLLPVDFYPTGLVSAVYSNVADFFVALKRSSAAYTVNVTSAIGSADDGTFVRFLGYPTMDYSQVP